MPLSSKKSCVIQFTSATKNDNQFSETFKVIQTTYQKREKLAKKIHVNDGNICTNYCKIENLQNYLQV